MIILIIGVVVGVVVGIAVGMGMRDEKDAEKTAAAKVLAMFDPSTGSGQAQITNDDVQRALGVSDTTAADYLSALEAQGKIRQVGGTGHAVHYVLNHSTSSR